MNINTNDALKRAAQCRELGDYSKAQEYLDMLRESDPENHMLWYEKSRLPIVQEEINAVVATGAIAMLVSLLTVFVINAYNSAPFFRIPMNVIILLLIPYALSVTGMTLYTKAKNGGNSTAAGVGLASNLTALIISNLSIVNAAILFFTK